MKARRISLLITAIVIAAGNQLSAADSGVGPYLSRSLSESGDAAIIPVAMGGDCGCPEANAACDACGCDDFSAGCCCDECDCCCDHRLFGIFAHSDHCFSDFISPMTNPIFFEDPRTLTEVRGVFFHQKIPAATGGGSAQLYAAQLRAALTDRLSIVAAKDGYIVSSNALVDDGWADVAIGLKYNLLKNYELQRLLSFGVSYELPIGSQRAFQGNGDGEFHLYLSAGTQLGCNWHWITGTGFRLPTDNHAESQVWYWSNHFDYYLGRGFYALVEVNWHHWMRSGERIPVNFEGFDAFNFGSTMVAGNNIVTGAFGVKYKPHDQLEVGIAWENPISQRQDILDNRLQVDLILRY